MLSKNALFFGRLVVFVVPGIDSRVSHMLGNHSTTEFISPSLSLYFNASCNTQYSLNAM
jgi:hypothetical protein